MKILGISGSLRRDSHNAQLLRAAALQLPPGVELELWEDLKAVPPYDADDEVLPRPRPVRELDAAIRAADAVLISTPEYNHSVPGQLKNALDWISRPLAQSPLRNKPVAVVGASTGLFGAVWAQAEVRKVLGAIGRQGRRPRAARRPGRRRLHRGRPARRRGPRARPRRPARRPRRHPRARRRGRLGTEAWSRDRGPGPLAPRPGTGGLTPRHGRNSSCKGATIGETVEKGDRGSGPLSPVAFRVARFCSAVDEMRAGGLAARGARGYPREMTTATRTDSLPTPPLAARLRGVQSSPVREILALTERPGVISFAGGLPAPELFGAPALRAAFDAALQRRAGRRPLAAVLDDRGQPRPARRRRRPAHDPRPARPTPTSS